jgi:hypothetical protein
LFKNYTWFSIHPQLSTWFLYKRISEFRPYHSISLDTENSLPYWFYTGKQCPCRTDVVWVGAKTGRHRREIDNLWIPRKGKESSLIIRNQIPTWEEWLEAFQISSVFNRKVKDKTMEKIGLKYQRQGNEIETILS